MARKSLAAKSRTEERRGPKDISVKKAVRILFLEEESLAECGEKRKDARKLIRRVSALRLSASDLHRPVVCLSSA